MKCHTVRLARVAGGEEARKQQGPGFPGEARAPAGPEGGQDRPRHPGVQAASLGGAGPARGEAHSAGQRREPREPREDAPGEREMMWETRPVTGSPGRVVPHEEQVHV